MEVLEDMEWILSKFQESFEDITSWGNFFPSLKNKSKQENTQRM